MVANGRKKFRLFIENVITNGDYIKRYSPAGRATGGIGGAGFGAFLNF